MSEVKLVDVIRCSSEDPSHPSENLLKGSSNQNHWVCSRDNKEPFIEVEIQLAKEAVISFIDIGNYGSQSVDILVSHSTRCRDEFVCLVPTFNFMTVAESKQGINRNQVKMFKGDDMLKDNKAASWDRLKLVCRQPYASGKQFGLSFICLKMAARSGGQESSKKDGNQNKLNNFFDTLKSDKMPVNKPKLSMWSSPLSPKVGFLQSPKLKENRSPVSPTDLNITPDRTPKRVLSAAAIKQFKEECACFLADVNFKELMQSRLIKISDLRSQMEKQRGLCLVRQQKILFMEIITERLKSMKGYKEPNEEPVNVECKKCLQKVPNSVLSIHSRMCNPTTPSRQRTPQTNRNQLCFDLDDHSDDENENPKKRKKLDDTKTTPSSTVTNGFNNTTNSSNESSVKSKLCTLLTGNGTTSTPSKTLGNSIATVAGGVAEKYLGTADEYFDSMSDGTDTSPIRDIKSQKTPSSASGYLRPLSEQTIPNVINISEETDTTECPICFRQIPMQKIEVHAASCEGEMEHDGNDDTSTAVSFKQMVKASNSSESNINNEIIDEQVQCPICGNMMDKKNIEVHVNVCLDMSN